MFFVIESESTNGLGRVATVYASAVEKRADRYCRDARATGRHCWTERADSSPFPTPADILLNMSDRDARDYQRRMESIARGR